MNEFVRAGRETLSFKGLILGQGKDGVALKEVKQLSQFSTSTYLFFLPPLPDSLLLIPFSLGKKYIILTSPNSVMGA